MFSMLLQIEDIENLVNETIANALDAEVKQVALSEAKQTPELQSEFREVRSYPK